MIINETYESYKNKIYDPNYKKYNYLSALDLKITQGDSLTITLPLSLSVSGITISFLCNEDYWSFDLTDEDITVSGDITINLTPTQTNKLQAGIISCNVRNEGSSYSYLVGECFTGRWNK